MDATGLVGLFGYRRMVDPIAAAAWDLILLSELATGLRSGQTVGRLRNRIERRANHAGALVESELKFQASWAEDPS